MGLCKCPRRQVTPLFCYEHRLNVCPHCLVEKHAQCVVKSYKEWLEDSDYDPTCPLCRNLLKDSSPDDVIRLECLHVYHFACLYQWGAVHPSNTAPAGFQCPICRAPVIPSPNAASPVANQCKEKLQKVNWARQGLGLPFLPELDQLAPKAPQPYNSDDVPKEEQNPQEPLNYTDSYFSSNGFDIHSMKNNEHKALLVNEPDMTGIDRDIGEEKYKRRPANEWLRRFLKSRSVNMSVRLRARTIFWIIFGILTIVTLIAIMSRISSPTSDYDPMLDPFANPNIRVHQENDRAGGSHF